MFRSARLPLTVLAMCLACAQAIAQTPPAPQPDIRDHRTSGGPAPTPPPSRVNLSKNPQQWEIRSISGIKPEETYSLYNLRRAELDLSSELTFKENSTRDATGWGANGGDFVFKRDTTSTDVRDHRVVRDGEFLAIYNTKTRRYMTASGLWADKPQYIWMVRKIATVSVGRSTSVRFALFNTQNRRWLMVCQGEPLPRINNERLCLYDDTFKPSISHG